MPKLATESLRRVQRYQGILGLLILFGVAFWIAPKSSEPGNLFGSIFFSMANLRNVLSQLAVPGLLATGATFVIISGGIDLSTGSLLGLLNCITATWLLKGASPVVTTLYVLAIGSLVGAVLGGLVSYTRLQPFVVTLAGMVSLRGIAFVYTNNANVSGIGNSLEWLGDSKFGVPYEGWVLLATVLLASALLKFTVFGRRLYALGGNAEAARYAGVPVNRVRITAYALNGFCIALATILFTGRNGNGQPSAGTGYELDAITAAVVGGTSLLGGFGNPLGTFVGALFIVCLNVLLILQGVSYYVGQGWKGVIILLAVYLQNLGRKTT
ncbi:MAG TPA: ABC transporter permease [Fimbriimonas sp.]|nr:ABC transporter permease [Fimbriimonas sp.]